MCLLERTGQTWRSLFASDPLGPHVIAPLDVLFVFSAEGVEGDS